ncbi:hypothetical protein L1278_002738 [Pontibacter sp. HSC-36F09]|nr:hypothetical protein [Pontibacter sp. HSC-36F09]
MTLLCGFQNHTAMNILFFSSKVYGHQAFLTSNAL